MTISIGSSLFRFSSQNEQLKSKNSQPPVYQAPLVRHSTKSSQSSDQQPSQIKSKISITEQNGFREPNN